MEKKYFENAKKNMDIWVYSAVISFFVVVAINYLLDKGFDFILNDKYQILFGMFSFICNFNSLKKARKNKEPDEMLDDIDEIKDSIKSSVNSAKQFVHDCTNSKTAKEEETKTDNSSTEEPVEESLSDDDDSEEITLPVYASGDDEDNFEVPPNNDEDDEFNIDTPLKGFIVAAGCVAVIFIAIYSIAAVICWSAPSDIAIGIAVTISVVVGLIGADATKKQN